MATLRSRNLEQLLEKARVIMCQLSISWQHPADESVQVTYLRADSMFGVELLWSSAGTPKRCFWILKRVGGIPCIAACTYCGQRFTSAMNPLATLNELTDNLMQQFDGHVCEDNILRRNRLAALTCRD